MTTSASGYALIAGLRLAVHQGKHGLADVPGALRAIIDRDAWQHFVIEETGEVVHHATFAGFATTPPLAGLGADVATLRNLCRDDVGALDALDRATARPNGTNRHTRGSLDANDPTTNENTTTGTLRRLRRDAPALHARVLAGELTPNAAAREAGFRRRRVSVYADDPDSAARTLARAFADRLPELITALEHHRGA